VFFWQIDQEVRAMKRTKMLTRLVFLLSLTLAIEMIGLPQPITGPLVNLMLLLTALLLNSFAAVILGLATPLMGLLRGQLPPILAPMVPFIMLANAVYILLFAMLASAGKQSLSLKRWRGWMALAIAAAGKTLILYAAATLVVPLLFGRQLPEAVIAAFTFPQLITATVGGAAAIGIYPALRRILGNNR